MIELLFRAPLLRVTTLVVVISILWTGVYIFRAGDGGTLLAHWPTAVMKIGRISGPVAAILGRNIGMGWWSERRGGYIGLGAGLLLGLTVGVIMGQCVADFLVKTYAVRLSQADNIGAVVGGLCSGALLGLVTTYSSFLRKK